MIKKIFSLKYNNLLILEMLKNTKVAILSSSFIAPILIIISLYGFVPNKVLAVWFLIHIIVTIFRINIVFKLYAAIDINSNKVKKYLYQHIVATTMHAALLGLSAIIAILYSAPTINFFMVTAIIISLTAGSISTLGTVFIAFLAYLVVSIFPIIVVLIYQGGFISYEFAFVLSVYILAHAKSGYRFFLTFKHNIELKSKFKTIYDKSSDGIAIIKNNQIIECNDALSNMFAYDDKNDFFKTPIFKLSPLKQTNNKSSTKQMLKMLKKAKENLLIFEWLHVDKYGSKFWVEITLNSIKINNDEIIHGVWRNIDKRKTAENEVRVLNDTLISKVDTEVAKNREKDKQLMQQSRLVQMGEMTSMIAHQWRQPLSAISSTSASLELKTKLGKVNDEIILKHTKKISEFSQHLSLTIDDFRNFFKTDKEKKEVSLSDIIDSVLSIVEVSITNQNIELVKDLNNEQKISTYPNEIKQVLLNLIKNAEDILLEKSVQNPYIKISTSINGNKNILEVSDNGGGIPDDIIENIFNPYFSTKLEKNGTGLGLYMSKTIIEEHCNGKLSASNDVNGAVFKVELASITS